MRLVSLPQQQLQCGDLVLDLSKPHIMGILNVTPDSFSDGGQYQHLELAFDHAQAMIAAGASIIDIGGESTRPGASAVSLEEELSRVIPVVELLSQLDVVLSIDTSSPEVIRAAVDAGAHIWNDVRGLTRPHALQTAAGLEIPVVLMHMRGEPTTMNALSDYRDVTRDVIAELGQRIDAAIEAGVRRENILIDPGFGFAKNTQQNLKLLQQFDQLQDLGLPVISALSRKRFIADVLGGVAPEQRAGASVAAHLLSIQQGACIVRAHDVKAMKDAIQIWEAMRLA